MTKAALTLEIKRLCPEAIINTRNNGHRTLIVDIIIPSLDIRESYTTETQKEAGDMLRQIYYGLQGSH